MILNDWKMKLIEISATIKILNNYIILFKILVYERTNWVCGTELNYVRKYYIVRIWTSVTFSYTQKIREWSLKKKSQRLKFIVNRKLILLWEGWKIVSFYILSLYAYVLDGTNFVSKIKLCQRICFSASPSFRRFGIALVKHILQ